jgi:hypothetical protein
MKQKKEKKRAQAEKFDRRGRKMRDDQAPRYKQIQEQMEDSYGS